MTFVKHLLEIPQCLVSHHFVSTTSAKLIDQEQNEVFDIFLNDFDLAFEKTPEEACY